MATIDVGTLETFGFGNDPIVIRQYISGIIGGKVLDVSDFTEDYIRAGHVIIRVTATDVYKPMPVASGEYGTLPDGCEYVGVCTTSTSKKEPLVGIMYRGEVNDVASPFPITGIKTALLAAVPTLVFKHD